MLLAVAKMPAREDAINEGARLVGLSLVDVRGRLAGTLPRVLVGIADADKAREAAAALEALGWVVLLCDPAAVQGDDERLLARTLEFSRHGLSVVDGTGASEPCPPHAISLIQRAVRRNVTTTTTETKSKQLAVGRAILSGGLMLTKTVTNKTTTTTGSEEPLLLLSRNDGSRDVLLYERRLDYRFLGAALQPSSMANFATLIERLRAYARAAPYDDRALRPGFASSVRFATVDPVDFALHMVQMAHLRGVA